MSQPSAQPQHNEVEVSVVIPCLNEADTLPKCLKVATAALQGLRGEIIVADNGSTDRSKEIAREFGAVVVDIPRRGYGSALMGGINAARGRYLIMGDADASYDFAEIPNFLNKLKEGYELVQGCRLPSGGGTVAPGAMPFLHRWWGNPMFSWMARRFFHAPIRDVNCGLRAFSKELFARLDQRCEGMEFAVEMVVKASLSSARIGELPITLHPDERVGRAPHLKTFRDGWRTLRYFLLSTPRWLFLYPGTILCALGLLGYFIALPGRVIGGIGFDVHTLLLSSLALLVGSQLLLFSVSAKTFALTEGLLPADPGFSRLYKFFTLERGLIAGCAACLAGLALIAAVILQWSSSGFGALDSSRTLRLVIPGTTLLMLGVQTVFGSFFLSLLGMSRKS